MDIDLGDNFDIADYPFATKFVEEKYFSSSLDGGFKFGTLSEYRSYENEGSPRLSDSGEGLYAAAGPGNIFGRSFTAPGTKLTNYRSFHNPDGIVWETPYDAYVFSASIGKHPSACSKEFFEKNGKLSHYLILDVELFFNAMSALFVSLHSEEHCHVVRPVTYLTDPRKVKLPLDKIEKIANGIISLANDAIFRAVFEKPSVYDIENEIRFSVIPCILKSPLKPLYIVEHPDFLKCFKNSIIASGKII